MTLRGFIQTMVCIFGISGCSSFESGSEQAGNIYVLAGIATPEACLISDRDCLEGKFYTDCDPDSVAVVETCLNWLAELESIPAPRHTQFILLLATTNYRLSEIRRWIELPMYPHLSGQGDQLLSIQQYRQKVRELAREAYDIDKSNTEVMRLLALTSDTDEENLQWQRLIVRTETPDQLTCRLLQGALNRVYDDSGNRKRAYSEVARCYTTSYSELEAQPGKWNVAKAALDNMQRAEQTIRRRRFLSEVRTDINPEQKLRELTNIERISPPEAEFTLRTLCLGAVREMLGVDQCTRALEQALDSVSGLRQEEAVLYADAIMEGIRELLRPTGMIASRDDHRSLRAGIATLVEQILISRGLESGKIFSIYSMLVSFDPDKSLEALIRAVELEPEDGGIRQQLGGLYARLGSTDLAIEQYGLAILYGPEYTHSSLRSAIDRLKANENLKDINQITAVPHIPKTGV